VIITSSVCPKPPAGRFFRTQQHGIIKSCETGLSVTGNRGVSSWTGAEKQEGKESVDKNSDFFLDTLRHMITADPLTFARLTA
jgi:hypothetical protein